VPEFPPVDPPVLAAVGVEPPVALDFGLLELHAAAVTLNVATTATAANSWCRRRMDGLHLVAGASGWRRARVTLAHRGRR
jgi:hypothetical protein